jgi:hypothetical protein
MDREEGGAPTLSIFSKESARRGVQPSMASPATAESQAGQPAATCSPRALLAKLLPRRTSACAAAAAERDDRDRLSRLTRAGFSDACSAGAAAEAAPSCCGWETAAAVEGWSRRREVETAVGLDVAGRPCTQPMVGWSSPAAGHGRGAGRRMFRRRRPRSGGGGAWGGRCVGLSKVKGALPLPASEGNGTARHRTEGGSEPERNGNALTLHLTCYSPDHVHSIKSNTLTMLQKQLHSSTKKGEKIKRYKPR